MVWVQRFRVCWRLCYLAAWKMCRCLVLMHAPTVQPRRSENVEHGTFHPARSVEGVERERDGLIDGQCPALFPCIGKGAVVELGADR